MKVRFYNAKILIMDHELKIIEGELWTEDDRISYIGAENITSEQMQWDREINVENNLLMPGFKNAHTHSPMTFLRSYADDLPLDHWLNDKIFPAEARLQEADIYYFVKLAVMEYVSGGITAAFDMYHFPEIVAKSAKECGFRVVLSGHINNFTGTDDENIRHMYEWYESLNQKNGLIQYKIGIHAEYTSSIPLMQRVAHITDRYKAPFYTHNSETAREVQQCIARYGKTPTELFDDLGLLKYGGGFYHCVHMTEKDLQIMKKRGIHAVTNPSSNAKLASGIAPIQKMLDIGIPISIGTDGAASNNCLDFFREMFLVTALQKLKEQDAAAVPAQEVLKMAVENGAAAMGLPDCNRLAEGKKADLIMFDLEQPNMRPMNHIIKNIVYSGNKQNVKLTMVNGKILYENGKFNIGIQPREVYKEVEERTRVCLKIEK